MLLTNKKAYSDVIGACV